MDILKEKNIKTQKIKGTTYVFIDKPIWDKTKKRSRHERNYIGKLGKDGEFIPNNNYLSRQNIERTEEETTNMPIADRKYFGATHLLDYIGKTTGIENDLKASFGGDFKKILSLVYFLILEGESSMYRFPKWAKTHIHPHGEVISSQRISDIFSNISEDIKIKFFRQRAKKCLENEYLAYDTTSISSYSELIEQMKYGHNKDLESLPQINLAIIFGEQSMLPVYYRKLSGNISDVTTVKKLLNDIDFLGIKKAKLVLDRGFYSAENINSLYRSKYKFIVSGRANIKFIKESITESMKSIKNFENFDIEQDIYYVSKTMKWKYPYVDKKGENCTENKLLYVHTYYNAIRAENDKAKFIKKLKLAEITFINGECTKSQQNLCEKYFNTTKNNDTVSVTYNQEAINEHMLYFGYFVLLSNHIKTPKDALLIYRNKDLIEKTFSNIKNRLDMRRTKVSSEESLEGKLFVQFVALIYIAHIHQIMLKANLYKNYSIQTLLDEFDIIEAFDYKGKKFHLSEITKNQRELFSCFGIHLQTTI